MMATDFNTLISNEALWSVESNRTVKWIVQYNDTLKYFRDNISTLSTDEVNALGKKCGHLKAMIEKYSKNLNK